MNCGMRSTCVSRSPDSTPSPPFSRGQRPRSRSVTFFTPLTSSFPFGVDVSRFTVLRRLCTWTKDHVSLTQNGIK